MPLAIVAGVQLAEMFNRPSAPAATPAPTADTTNQAAADAFRKAEHADTGLMDPAALRKNVNGAAVTVKKGDTLEGLLHARGYSNAEIYTPGADGKTMLDKVVRQNKLTDANTIQAGQELQFEAKAKPTAQETKANLDDKKVALKEAVSGNNGFQDGVDKGSKFVSNGIRDGADWLGKQSSEGFQKLGFDKDTADIAKGVIGGLGELGGGVVDGLAHVVSHPLDTLSALGNVVAHPIDTAKALGADVERVYDKEGFAGAAVYAVGNAAMMATGVLGAGRAAGTLAGKVGSLAKTAGNSAETAVALRTTGNLSRAAEPTWLKPGADGVYEPAPTRSPGWMRQEWQARENGTYYEGPQPAADRAPGWLRRRVETEQRMIEDSGARFTVQA